MLTPTDKMMIAAFVVGTMCGILLSEFIRTVSYWSRDDEQNEH